MSDTEDLTCYTIGLNFVTSSNQYFPCGGSNGGSGVQSCCYAGDYCMEDSICHYTHSVTNGTGFYMAGCTDPTWQDPACPKQCSKYSSLPRATNRRWLTKSDSFRIRRRYHLRHHKRPMELLRQPGRLPQLPATLGFHGPGPGTTADIDAHTAQYSRSFGLSHGSRLHLLLPRHHLHHVRRTRK